MYNILEVVRITGFHFKSPSLAKRNCAFFWHSRAVSFGKQKETSLGVSFKKKNHFSFT